MRSSQQRRLDKWQRTAKTAAAVLCAEQGRVRMAYGAPKFDRPRYRRLVDLLKASESRRYRADDVVRAIALGGAEFRAAVAAYKAADLLLRELDRLVDDPEQPA